jgi:hypothetical protein
MFDKGILSGSWAHMPVVWYLALVTGSESPIEVVGGIAKRDCPPLARGFNTSQRSIKRARGRTRYSTHRVTGKSWPVYNEKCLLLSQTSSLRTSVCCGTN